MCARLHSLARFAIVSGFVVACAKPPVAVAPPVRARVPLAVTADSLFWRTFHAGAYDSIGPALFLLQAAYVQNPMDPQTAAHIAFAHAWRLGERTRMTPMSPAIIDDATLARHYFEQAQRTSPSYDPRFHGFSSVFRMAEGSIHRDSAAWRQGLAEGRKAVAAWPEFNWFTVGYVLSAEADTSPLFDEGLEMQWATVDACARGRVDRKNPTFAAVLAPLATEPDARRKRACSNSWIAPHNVQGFLLNMGDMIVKKGDPELARRVYALAKESDGYANWPYASMLEDRIRNADANVAAFRSGKGAMMGASKVTCSGCHQVGR